MILQRFVGRNVGEALARVESELGRNALIVDTIAEPGHATILAREAAHVDKQSEPLPRRRRTRETTPGRGAFAEIEARMHSTGLSQRVIDVVFRAVSGIDATILERGSPALAGVVQRILAGLLTTHTARPRHLALVGSTGVGKTTTLAKLASLASIEHGESVAILTTDTYRIAAVEQLRAFADMLDVPFRVAFTPQDLRAGLREFSDHDRVFVDTSGRSPRDRKSLRAMRGLLCYGSIETALCLPAGCRRQDAEDAVAAFGPFEPRSLLLTKWDETRVPGEVIGLAIEHGTPVSYVTDGQRVPEDIRVARATDIAAEITSAKTTMEPE